MEFWASNLGCTWLVVSVQGHDNHAHCLQVGSTVWLLSGVSNRLFSHERTPLTSVHEDHLNAMDLSYWYLYEFEQNYQKP